MNLGPCGTDVLVNGTGLDLGLGWGLAIGLGSALGIAIGLGSYIKHCGRHAQLGRASRPTLAWALEPTCTKQKSSSTIAHMISQFDHGGKAQHMYTACQTQCDTIVDMLATCQHNADHMSTQCATLICNIGLCMIYFCTWHNVVHVF